MVETMTPAEKLAEWLMETAYNADDDGTRLLLRSAATLHRRQARVVEAAMVFHTLIDHAHVEPQGLAPADQLNAADEELRAALEEVERGT